MIDDEVAVLALEHVEPDGAIPVVGVDETRPLGRSTRKPLQDRLHEIALGVDDHRGAPGLGVLQHEVRKERRLPRAGLADHVEVMASVRHGDGDGSLHPGVIGLAENLPCRRKGARGGHRPRAGSLQSRYRARGRQAGDLRELRHRQEVGAGEPAGQHGPRPPSDAPAPEAVAALEHGEGSRQTVDPSPSDVTRRRGDREPDLASPKGRGGLGKDGADVAFHRWVGG